MLRATEFAHWLIRSRLQPGAICIDATAGNGKDTLFLARLAGSDGRVYAFDIQQSACDATRRLVDSAPGALASVTVHCTGHERMGEVVPHEDHGAIAAIMLNLGYLPGGDKACITRPATTSQALVAATRLLKIGGILTVVAYPGHPGGGEEAEGVCEWFAALDPGRWAAIEYRTLNANVAAPFVLAAERKC